jgi:hypothetical protein
MHLVALSLLVAHPTQSSATEGELEPQVFVSSQDAEGVTQLSFNADFLKIIENHIVERTRVRAKEYLASIGKKNQQVKFRSEATYIEKNGKKLFVIRIIDQAGIGHVTIGGVVGTELKRVLCTNTTPGTPAISFGSCGRKVKEVFGVSL